MHAARGQLFRIEQQALRALQATPHIKLAIIGFRQLLQIEIASAIHLNHIYIYRRGIKLPYAVIELLSSWDRGQQAARVIVLSLEPRDHLWVLQIFQVTVV